jgi:hypothetical protein
VLSFAANPFWFPFSLERKYCISFESKKIGIEFSLKLDEVAEMREGNFLTALSWNVPLSRKNQHWKVAWPSSCRIQICTDDAIDDSHWPYDHWQVSCMPSVVIFFVKCIIFEQICVEVSRDVIFPILSARCPSTPVTHWFLYRDCDTFRPSSTARKLFRLLSFWLGSHSWGVISWKLANFNQFLTYVNLFQKWHKVTF